MADMSRLQAMQKQLSALLETESKLRVSLMNAQMQRRVVAAAQKNPPPADATATQSMPGLPTLSQEMAPNAKEPIPWDPKKREELDLERAYRARHSMGGKIDELLSSRRPLSEALMMAFPGLEPKNPPPGDAVEGALLPIENALKMIPGLVAAGADDALMAGKLGIKSVWAPTELLATGKIDTQIYKDALENLNELGVFSVQALNDIATSVGLNPKFGANPLVELITGYVQGEDRSKEVYEKYPEYAESVERIYQQPLSAPLVLTGLQHVAKIGQAAGAESYRPKVGDQRLASPQDLSDARRRFETIEMEEGQRRIIDEESGQLNFMDKIRRAAEQEEELATYEREVASGAKPGALPLTPEVKDGIARESRLDKLTPETPPKDLYPEITGATDLSLREEALALLGDDAGAYVATRTRGELEHIVSGGRVGEAPRSEFVRSTQPEAARTPLQNAAINATDFKTQLEETVRNVSAKRVQQVEVMERPYEMPRKGNLTALKSRAQVDGGFTVDVATGEPGAVRRLYMYEGTGEPEKLVASGKTEYLTSLPSDKIYDIAKDPDGLVKASNYDPNTFERAIKDAGYQGYTNSDRAGGTMANIVAVFDDVDVAREVQSRPYEEVIATRRQGVKPVPAPKEIPATIEEMTQRPGTWDKLVAISRQRLSGLPDDVTLHSGIDPVKAARTTYDMSIVAADMIRKGARKASDVADELINQFGREASVYVKDAFRIGGMRAEGLKADEHLRTFMERVSGYSAPEDLKPAGRQSPLERNLRENLVKQQRDLHPKLRMSGRERQTLIMRQLAEAAQKEGIGTKITDTDARPAVTQSGIAVPKDFFSWKGYKDVEQGFGRGSYDPTTYAQTIDGSLSLAEKVGTEHQAGPVERYVTWRSRDMMQDRFHWVTSMKARGRAAFDGLSKKEEITVTKILETLQKYELYSDPAQLAAIDRYATIGATPKTMLAAQQTAKIFDALLQSQNMLRAQRNQPLIKTRGSYAPHVFRQLSLYERFMGKLQPKFDSYHTPELVMPKPGTPFNPRALAREYGMPEDVRQMSAKRLLDMYIDTAARDVFNTSIIQNGRAFAGALESMGLTKSATGLNEWLSTSFAGTTPGIDAGFNLGPTTRRVFRAVRRARNIAVFPLNITWNLTVQTSSAALTMMRYGVRSSLNGAMDWFLDPQARKDAVRDMYSMMVKSQRRARASMQDIGSALPEFDRTFLQTTEDAFNYFTDVIEYNMSGWSALSALDHGTRKGLKGEALKQYASDGVNKTQSLYNHEDLPQILQSEIVRTAVPFQTFSFSMWNTMREFAGKAGTPPKAFNERAAWVLRFLGAATAFNMASSAISGRKPWDLTAFIPFYSATIAPVSSAITGDQPEKISQRALASPLQMAAEVSSGIYDVIAKDDPEKLKRAMIRYGPGFFGVPGGIQMARIVEGLEAIANGGEFDRHGRQLFPVSSTKERLRALVGGPYFTVAGQDYLKARQKDMSLIDRSTLGEPVADVMENVPLVGNLVQREMTIDEQIVELQKDLSQFVGELQEEIEDAAQAGDKAKVDELMLLLINEQERTMKDIVTLQKLRVEQEDFGRVPESIQENIRRMQRGQREGQ